MKKIYLAGPWFTEKSDILENYVYNISRLCNNKYKVFRPRSEVKEHPLDTFYGNVNAIKECDILVAVISEKDVGTSFEIGYAKALNKQVCLVGFNENDFKSKTNLMLAYSADKCLCIENLDKLFEDKLSNEHVINVKYNWENIE